MPDVLSQFAEVRSVGELISGALHELKPVKGNLPISIGVSVISLVLSLNMLNAPNSVELIVNLSMTLKDVFWGYSELRSQSLQSFSVCWMVRIFMGWLQKKVTHC